ncbi:MAG: efflux RND transporter periplasmic adaptor subunit [Dehalobacterium sp.]
MKRGFALILLSILIFSLGCGAKPAEDNKEAAEETKGKLVSAITVKKLEQPLMLSAVGLAEPEQEADLFFTASGIITQLFVTNGTKISQGQVLATLDSDTAENSVSSLVLANAQDELKNKEIDLERVRKLYQEGVSTERDLEEAQRVVDRAANQVAQVQQSFVETKLKAPFSGIVAEIMHQAGKTISAGTPVIKMVDLSQVKITLDVANDLISQYQVGQTATVKRDDGNEEQGKVSAISPVTDPQTGKYRVEITLSNTKGSWRGGMVAKVEVPRTLTTGIILPLSCVGVNQDQQYVLAIENGVAKRHVVEVGQIIGDSIEILSGIKPDDLVISSGIAYIIEDEKVTVKGE